MFSNDNNVETIAQFVEVVKHYAGLQTEYIARHCGEVGAIAHSLSDCGYSRFAVDYHTHLPLLCRSLRTGDSNRYGTSLLHCRRCLPADYHPISMLQKEIYRASIGTPSGKYLSVQVNPFKQHEHQRRHISYTRRHTSAQR